MVVTPQLGIGNVYEIIVDGADGRILHRWNRLHFDTTEPITFNIYRSDSPAPGSPGTDTPNGFQYPFVSRALGTVTPEAMMTYSPNGWIDDGVNETLGNNVDAHTDLNADNQPDLPRPHGDPYRVFDFPQDNSMAPSTYRPAAVTQLFYLLNLYHDKLYSLGFDEAAHNFQQINFSGMGVGGDRMQGDAQDGSGTNNANFNGMGADGTPARIQMYVWTGPNPDRDGDLDADVVFHEVTHGTSIRLNDGTLVAPQGGGMGEGWSDFFAVVLNSQPDDDVNAVYPCVAYSTYQWLGGTNNYYFGIRRFPYSTDLNKNPETLADIDPAQQSFPPGVPRNTIIPNTANEVHNVGEVWCVTLLECRANLVTHQGFSGNDLVLQLAVDGMKLDPATPTFLQARDAILQADMIDNAGANLLQSLWPAFAKRGMGLSATVPAANTTSGIVEAFDAPVPQLQFSYPLGQPLAAALDGSTTVTVQIGSLFGGMLVPGSVQLVTSANNMPYVSAPMVETTPNVFVGNLPSGICLSKIRWYVTAAEATSGLTSNPPNAPSGSYQTVAATGIVPDFADDFETDQGWVVGAPGDSSVASGFWVRVDPNGSSAQPEDDYTPTGTMCFVTGQHTPGNNADADDVDAGTTTLTSPTFTALHASDWISYARWFYGSAGDSFMSQISNNNGATWVTIENLTSSAPVWTLRSFTLSTYVTPTTQMKLRFRATDGTPASTCEAAVDNVMVFDYACALNGNCNGVDGIGLLDYALFEICLTGPDAGPIASPCGCADTDADSDVDLQDVAAFQNVFNGQ
jgi:hypothetical protein